jgi:hypothetical protein
MLEYQKLKQREWYAKSENKKRKSKYGQIPKVKAHHKKYQEKYQAEHVEKMRELKRNWAKKHRSMK